MMRSFGALYASYDKRIVGVGHEFRIAGEGVVMWLRVNQE